MERAVQQNQFCYTPFLKQEVEAFHQQAVHSPLEQQKGQRQSGPIPCQNCGKPCKGEVLRVQNNHFHIKCFVCKGHILSFCARASSGFQMEKHLLLITEPYSSVKPRIK
ncbi:Actin-binding LIM protein 2 [Anabarilius grahami]|uniref:Actin-binding LIM protein 2 n=1 Tax=Anabarilius grahami TaxID=495550 RepID=A0A3N0XN63_ANAGA|nr:Actin-binding LIM protein 2 [Anabarilius grahami]